MKLSPVEKDALTEIASIGTGNASSALSNLIGKIVNLVTPTVDIVPIKDIPKLIGGPKKMIVGVYTPVAGDLVGNMFAIFPKENALLLADLVGKKELGTTKQIGAGEKRALNQIMHSLSVTYLNAIGEFLGVSISQANPRFISTFGENIVDFILLGVEKKPEYIIFLKTDFSVESKIKGDFLLILAVESVDKLVDLLKQKVGEK